MENFIKLDNMKRYINYLKYVLKHKIYVFIECWKYGIIWRGLVHDLPKFYPVEFIPYMKHFYNKDGSKIVRRDKSGFYKPTDDNDEDFKKAWHSHFTSCPHHWQWWIIPEHDEMVPLEMSEKYVLEMVADWKGAAKAIGTGTAQSWYKINKNKMILHPNTRRKVEILLFGDKILF